MLPENQNNFSLEEKIGPTRIPLSSVGLMALGSATAGFFGGVLIFAVFFIFIGKTNAFKEVYPFLYSLIGLFPVFATVCLTYFFQHLIQGYKYKQNLVIFGQLSVFAVLLYIFMTPMYLVTNSDAQRTMIFFVHVLLSVFGSSLLVELLASYRYVLIGVYGSIVGLLVAIFGSVCIFVYSSTESVNNLYILIGSILLINFSVHTFRALFEFAYANLSLSSGTDYL